jgi:nucleotide-binding universal stress UspA family protein
MADIKKILIATDFSECAKHVLEQGGRLAQPLSAELLLVHVFDTTPYYSSAAMLQMHKTAMETGLAEAQRELTAHGLRVQTRLDYGVPHERIVELARLEKADLIMMGTHGRSGVRYVLMGSVAERVARLSEVPVMTVRAAA